MALPANMVWEIRGSNGSDSNGGGFVPGSGGTDYSQQNAAQYSGTNLVIGATNTNVTSVSHSFISSDVGNIIQITAGTNFTTGFYEIVSVASGIATLDRACGTALASGGTWAEGGALATLNLVISRVTYNPAPAPNGCTFWIQGTVTVSATHLAEDAGWGFVIGYGTSRGDNNRAILQTTTAGVTIVEMYIPGGSWSFANIVFYHDVGFATGYGFYDDGGGLNSLFFQNCVFGNSYHGVYTTGVIEHGYMFACRVGATLSDGVSLNGNWTIVGSIIYDNTGSGIALPSTGGGGLCSVIKSVIYGNTGTAGISASDDTANTMSIIISQCSIASNTGDGVRIYGTGSLYFRSFALDSSIIYGNGGYGINGPALSGTINYGNICQGRNNAFGDNTSGARNNLPTLPGDFTLSANPFNNASGGDFSLNTTSGGGAACREAGFPGTLEDLGTGYIDVGALQSAAGGSTTYVINKNVTLYQEEEP